MECFEQDRGLSEVGILLLILVGDMEGLHGGREQLVLLLNNSLMLTALSYPFPIRLQIVPLASVRYGAHVLSKFDEFWDLVHGFVLELLEFVVLHIEFDPIFVVEIACFYATDKLDGRSLNGTLGMDDLHLLQSPFFHEFATNGPRILL